MTSNNSDSRAPSPEPRAPAYPGPPTNQCLIIAEVGLAHDGSLGLAHAFIDEIARNGADAVKFQTHIADAESTPGEPFRVRFSPQDATRYDYWKRMEFSEGQWRELSEHARRKGLIFLSTPFSFEAVELLARLGMPAWKVGSGEVTNVPMLARMAATGRPLLISSGMSSWEELDRAVSTASQAGAPVALTCAGRTDAGVQLPVFMNLMNRLIAQVASQ